MTSYLIATTLVFAFLTFIWTRKDGFNFLLKFTFGVMTGFSGFFLLQALGYIAKVAA